MILDGLLDIIFPSYCVGCNIYITGGKTICEKCFAGIKINSGFFCGRCSARLPVAKKICHPDFPYILGSASSYDDEKIKNLVRLLKFKYIKKSAEPLADLIVRYISATNLEIKNFTVVPIPLSRKRLRERGFNQAELIAAKIAEYFGLPLRTDILLRQKHTKPQSETKTLYERKNNVIGCFVINNSEKLLNGNILLIDDVTTSGATLLAAAEALKLCGARKIIALTAARA